MSIGNILHVIEEKTGLVITEQILDQQYHEGNLSPYLPDDCSWFVQLDGDFVASIEPMSKVEIRDRIPLIRQNYRNGMMVTIRKPTGDALPYISVKMFPECDAWKQFEKRA